MQLTDKQIQEGWQIVKFADIAKEPKITTKSPLEDGLEYYIGLEHLDPQSLRIQRRGKIAVDNPSFTRRFKPGHILFGKRRSYQKKAAVADFEGICSGDIIVIEANSKIITPELLPFIVQSDMFFDWAIKTSSGSLSPRTKWKALAEFKFPLPPLRRQKETLKVLEKGLEILARKESQWNCSIQLLKSLLSEYFCVNSNNLKSDCQHKGWEMKEIGDALNISNNQRNPLSTAVRNKMQGDFPYYGPTGVLDFINEHKYDGTYALIGEDGDHFLKWKTQPMTQMISGKFNVNNHAHVIKGSKECSLKWFYYYFYHQSIEKYLTRQGAGRYKLTKVALEKIPIPIPSIEEQEKLCKAADQITKQISLLETEFKKSIKLTTEVAKNLLFKSSLIEKGM